MAAIKKKRKISTNHKSKNKPKKNSNNQHKLLEFDLLMTGIYL